jgi:hypothetical protein
MNALFARVASWMKYSEHPNARSITVGIVALVAVVLAVLFYSATWRTGDDARYYNLGLAISEGAGLVDYENPMQPPETITPPLYPSLIAAVIQVTSHPIVWVKRMGNLMYVGAVIMVLLALMRSEKYPHTGVLGACMGMFAVGVVSFGSFIMSDILFILMVYTCLWMDRKCKQWALFPFLLGCCCALTYLTRTAGLALIAAILFHALIQRQWRRILFIGLGLGLILGPWFYRKLFIVQVPDQYLAMAEGYAQVFQGKSLWASFPLLMANEFTQDLPLFIWRIMPAHFFYSASKVFGTPGFWRIVAILMGTGTLAGLFLRLRRWNSVDYFFIFSLLLIAAIPGALYVKYYFFPLLPIAAFYFFHFMAWTAKQFESRFNWLGMAWAVRIMAVGIFSFSLLLDFAAGTVHFIKENPRRVYGVWAPERFLDFQNEYDDAWARVSESATWLMQSTPTNALLLSRKPDHLYLMSQRQGWRYEIPMQVQCSTTMESVEQFAPDRMVFLLEDSFPSGEALYTYGNNRDVVLNETVRKEPDSWRVVYVTSEPVTRIWAYVPSMKTESLTPVEGDGE